MIKPDFCASLWFYVILLCMVPALVMAANPVQESEGSNPASAGPGTPREELQGVAEEVKKIAGALEALAHKLEKSVVAEPGGEKAADEGPAEPKPAGDPAAPAGEELSPDKLRALADRLKGASSRIDVALVATQGDSVMEWIQRWLLIVLLAIVSIFLLLAWRRKSRLKAPEDGPKGKETLPSPPPLVQEAGGQRPRREVGPAPANALPKEDSRKPETDEFAHLPHARIGRVLAQLCDDAVPTLEAKLNGIRPAERFLRELGEPLRARIARFKDAALRGDGYLERHWVEQDLVTTLNTLSELLSVVIEEKHRGGRVGRAVEEELQRWLYQKLAPVCQDEGLFIVEEILPFTTRFDPKNHEVVETRAYQGADDLILGIKSIGRRDPRNRMLTHKAEVVIGA